jgi:hypothetical protein
VKARRCSVAALRRYLKRKTMKVSTLAYWSVLMLVKIVPRKTADTPAKPLIWGGGGGARGEKGSRKGRGRVGVIERGKSSSQQSRMSRWAGERGQGRGSRQALWRMGAAKHGHSARRCITDLAPFESVDLNETQDAKHPNDSSRDEELREEHEVRGLCSTDFGLCSDNTGRHKARM